MGTIFTDMFHRLKKKSGRKEDYSCIYNRSLSDEEIISEEKYKSYIIRIISNGRFPLILILEDISGISSLSGKTDIKLKFQNSEIECYRTLFYSNKKNKIAFRIQFNRKEDFVLGVHTGKKYSLQELKDIGKDFCDQISKMEISDNPLFNYELRNTKIK